MTIKELFENTELSEDVKLKVQAVFEDRIAEETEKFQMQLQEQEQCIIEEYNKKADDYSEYLKEEYESKAQEYIESEVMPMVEKYIDYAVSEFIAENKIDICGQLKVKMADKFLSDLSALVESYNVIIPESGDSVIDKIEDANNTISKLLDQKSELESTITEMKKKKIIDVVSSGLTETQKEKIVKSAGRIEFIDEQQFETALKYIKESYKPESINQDSVVITESRDDQWLDRLFQ